MVVVVVVDGPEEITGRPHCASASLSPPFPLQELSRANDRIQLGEIVQQICGYCCGSVARAIVRLQDAQTCFEWVGGEGGEGV